jgi:hypothetical protein
MYKIRGANSIITTEVKAEVNSEPKGKYMLQVRDKTTIGGLRG